MVKGYLPLALLVLLCRATMLLLPAGYLAVDHSACLHAAQSTGDPEAILTLGGRLPFSAVGVYELELLPRISDGLATHIDDRHDLIALHSKRLPAAKRSSALGLAEGVGAGIAKRLGENIDLTR